MKKSLLLVLLGAILTIGAAAQPITRVVVNNQDPKTGLHTLLTSSTIVRTGFTDRHPLRVSVMASERRAGWEYTIYVELADLVSRAIPEGAALLLRTKSGEVFELVNILTEYESKDIVGVWIEGTASKTYYNKAAYTVTEEQLETISEGVVKIRFQTSSGSFDTEYKKDKLGAAIAEQLHVLREAIAQSSDIRSGF